MHSSKVPGAPWRHQVQVVERLQQPPSGREAREDWRTSQKFLVPHSTGSGKSITMALMAWSLRRLECADGCRFAVVLILSDRVQLNQQPGCICKAFLEKAGVPRNHVRTCSDGHSELTKVLGDVAAHKGHACNIVVTTKQRFDKMGDAGACGMLQPIARRGRVAIIGDHLPFSIYHVV